MKRLVIITDSLGMPRKELEIEKTWTNMVIRHFGGCFEVYFFPRRACTSNHIIESIDDLIIRLKPDIVIFQIGIVDSVRRVFPLIVLKTISKIPIVGKVIHYFSRKFHYQITRMHKIQYVPNKEFKHNIIKIVSTIKNNSSDKSRCAFLKIAQPTGHLLKSCYNCVSDIVEYNLILEKLSIELKFDIIDPYYNIEPEKYLLGDGHHLNEFGNHLIFDKLLNYLDKIE